MPPSCSCRQFGNAVGVTGAVGVYPAVTGASLPLFSVPLAVALCVALDPALKVVNVVSGKDFARSEIISKMCHDFFSSLLGGSLPLCDYIIPQNPLFVKGFWKSFLRIFCLFEDVGNNINQAENPKSQPKGNLRERGEQGAKYIIPQHHQHPGFKASKGKGNNKGDKYKSHNFFSLSF